MANATASTCQKIEPEVVISLWMSEIFDPNPSTHILLLERSLSKEMNIAASIFL
jgi:hypothetical protein